MISVRLCPETNHLTESVVCKLSMQMCWGDEVSPPAASKQANILQEGN